MAILTNAGRVALATAVMAQPLHMAWGAGNASWDTVPVAESLESEALLTPIGYRKAQYAAYCEPDDAGEIVVPTGRFSETLTPTKHIYMRFAFDFTDAPTSAIREIGVLVGATTNPALPVGQMYFEPSQVTAPGFLLLIEHIQKFERSASVRQTFEFVFTA